MKILNRLVIMPLVLIASTGCAVDSYQEVRTNSGFYSNVPSDTTFTYIQRTPVYVYPYNNYPYNYNYRPGYHYNNRPYYGTPPHYIRPGNPRPPHSVRPRPPNWENRPPSHVRPTPPRPRPPGVPRPSPRDR